MKFWNSLGFRNGILHLFVKAHFFKFYYLVFILFYLLLFRGKNTQILK